MDFLRGLNPPQREAVSHGEGPLLILAGAGSGKTRVITHRICHLISSVGLPGHAIMAVTFTNKAADEMRHRVESMLGSAEVPLLSTFHSFCVRLLRRDGAPLAQLRPGFTPRFLIYDEDDQLAVVKASYQRLDVDESFMPYRTALARISHAKNLGQKPADMASSARDANAARLAAVFEEYEGNLRQANALDFDDLLVEAVRLLRHDESTRSRYNDRLQYVLVDEFQDTNRCQYELMRLVSGRRRNVCAVGDEDQSIYSWRGADIRNILDFESDFPDAKVIRLEQNYRSTRNILEAAGAVVAKNTQRKGKLLWTETDAGERIEIYQAPDSENEALYIADMIQRLLSRNAQERVAVLYRTNWQSRQIEEALRRYGRRYVVVGGLSFYQRAEIKDVLAYLKLLVSPHDPVSFLRVINRPARGIGKTTIDQIAVHARDRRMSPWEASCSLLDEKLLPTRAHAALSDFRKLITDLLEMVGQEPLGTVLKRIVDQTGYGKMIESSGEPSAEARLENLSELVNASVDAANRGEGATEFLDHTALVAESDELDEKAQVSLLTLHNAKGLEWPVVVIAGLEEGLFPHSRSLDSPGMLEEERRLCYVGMTRARKRLVLTWARARRRFGGGPSEQQKVSRFLREVPGEYTRHTGAGGPTISDEDAEPADSVDLFTERHEVREHARKNTYTGKTYNSLENISQFFRERGLPAPPVSRPVTPPVVPPRPAAPQARAASQPKTPFRAGVTVRHPRYGSGLILRREGDGEEAKLTVSFSRHGLKKLVAKYAGLTIDE